LLILGIDTTEKNIHIALAEKYTVLAEIEEKNNKTEELINYFEKLFLAAGKKHNELSAIGVVTGPGGYTGTRAGVSVAKTMAQILNIPLFGFTKPEALLRSRNNQGLTAAATDIKRNEVYGGIGSVEEGTISYIQEPAIFTIDLWIELLSSYKEEITFPAGEFIDKKEIFAALPANITVDYNYYLKPSHITAITAFSLEKGWESSFRDVSPFYIREAI
jgi:tRNA threonylcarbamoyladenosine biosynthesis protein TsaB